jgi:hypothetical protein
MKFFFCSSNKGGSAKNIYTKNWKGSSVVCDKNGNTEVVVIPL